MPHFDHCAHNIHEIIQNNLPSHDRLRIVSIIRDRLWNRAKWFAVFFITYPNNDHPPILSLTFGNRGNGSEIFMQWRNEFGNIDEKEKIRLVVIRGIDKKNPFYYRVIVSSNPNLVKNNEDVDIFQQRIHKMEAKTPENLDRFIDSYENVGFFFFAPSFIEDNLESIKAIDGNMMPSVEMNLRIAIHHIYIRNAWEIGLGDIDSVGILEEDNPIIPKNVKNAPVLKLLQSRRVDNIKPGPKGKRRGGKCKRSSP